MPKLTIDGKEIEVAPGTTVIRAALDMGLFVPHYCYHPGLSIAGNCRMCLVEIEKMPKLAISCSTVAADGMVVHTKSPKVKEAQDAILEFLLINHPLDCPICDQAGECKLQEFAFEFGPARSRFLEEKVHKPKGVDLGAHIVFDAERCILCSRCVRFCQEVSGTGELTISDRSDHAVIETFPGKRLDNAYSGNTVDICPVGALTLKEFRFRQRVWFLKDVPSTCAGCARGCNVRTGVSKGKILRITPRENLEVNRWWICDEGRLSYEKLYGPLRIGRPRLAERFSAMALPEGEFTAVASPAPAASEVASGPVASALGQAAYLVPAAGSRFAPGRTPRQPDASPVLPILNEGVPGAPRSGSPRRPGETVMAIAINAAARTLGEARAAGGADAIAVLLSPRATNEDLYAMAKLARDSLGATRAALPRFERGEDDAILIRKDKSPNQAGAQAILGGMGITIESADALVQRIGRGTVRAIVALGPNLAGQETAPVQDPNPLPGGGATGYGAGAPPPTSGGAQLFDALAAAAAAAGATLIAIDAFESPLTERATIVMPALTYGEIEGTYTNFEGRVQRVRAGVAPATDGLPVYRIAQEIARALGAPPSRTGPQETFSAIAAEVPAFSGLTYAKIGEAGARLAAEGARP